VAIRVVGLVELIRELAVDILRAQPVAADTCPEAEAEGMQAVVVAAVTAKDEFAISSK
jgi:Flp pilus assembly protein CpaB